MDWSSPSSSVHAISQARILEWVAISFSQGSSWPRDQTQVSCIVDGLLHRRQMFYCWATREALSSDYRAQNSISSIHLKFPLGVVIFASHSPLWTLTSLCSLWTGLGYWHSSVKYRISNSWPSLLLPHLINKKWHSLDHSFTGVPAMLPSQSGSIKQW